MNSVEFSITEKLMGEDLITEGMSANDNRFDPSRNGFGDATQRDGFPEDGAAQNISNLGGLSNLYGRNEEESAFTVPFGLRHISFRLNSSTRASSGVIVAHLIPTLCLRIAFAASMVTWSFVWNTADQRAVLW
jgi:hypothetical protein